jgi:hypothetical protein
MRGIKVGKKAGKTVVDKYLMKIETNLKVHLH